MHRLFAISPIFPATVGIVVGIVASSVLPVWAAVIVVALAALLYKLMWRWTAAGLLFVAVGMILTAVMAPGTQPRGLYGHKVTACAAVSAVSENEASVSLLVSVDSIGEAKVAPFIARITVGNPEFYYSPGERVEFVAVIDSLPSAPMLPGDPDLSLYYKSEGVVAVAYCNSGDCHTVEPAPPVTRAFNRARIHMARSLVATPLSPGCSAFLLAALLGDDSLLAPDTSARFRQAGVSHVLALSGLHVGIVVMIVMMFSFPLNLSRRGFYIRPVVAIVFVWVYAMLVGLPPSVVRAAIMTTVYMLARLIQKGHTGVNSLFISVAVILALRPMWLYSVGFQLSVAAVAAILAFTSLVPPEWKRHPVRYWLLMSVLIPVAAILGTGLIAAIHFASFPLLFLPANLAVGILIPWILGLGMAVMLFASAGWHLLAITWLTNRLYALFSLVINGIGSLSFAEVSGISLSAWVMAPYAAALVFLWLALSRRSWSFAASSFGCAVLTWICAILLAPPAPRAELYILPEKDATRVVMSAGSAPTLILPDLSPDTVEAVGKANRRHGGYLRLRGADVPPDGEGFRVMPAPRRLTVGSCSFAFLADPSDTLSLPVGTNYLVVCKGFKARLAPVCRALRPDTVLLSPALHPKIALRLAAEMADTLPVRNLRERPFSLFIP